MAYSPCTHTLIEIDFIVLKEWMKSVIWLLEKKKKTKQLDFSTLSHAGLLESTPTTWTTSVHSAKCYAPDHTHMVEGLRLFGIDHVYPALQLECSIA